MNWYDSSQTFRGVRSGIGGKDEGDGMTEAARRDTPKRDVALIGRNDFQNKLLARRGPSFAANVLALLDVAGIAARDINVRLQVLATCAKKR